MFVLDSIRKLLRPGEGRGPLMSKRVQIATSRQADGQQIFLSRNGRSRWTIMPLIDGMSGKFKRCCPCSPFAPVKSSRHHWPSQLSRFNFPAPILFMNKPFLFMVPFSFRGILRVLRSDCCVCLSVTLCGFRLAVMLLQRDSAVHCSI